MDLFDLHCDTIYECLKTGQGIADNNLAISLSKGAAISRWCQAFAMFIHDDYRGADAVDLYNRMHAVFDSELKKNSDKITLCRTASEIKAANDSGKCAAILTVEGGAALGGDINMLNKMYNDGVRIITLTWNGDNELASGIKGSGGGLTKFGREVITKMGDLGILVDVSHLNERGFYEVLDMGVAPIIATHSNFRRLHYHVRNLTDEQFLAILRSGGLVGLNFYCEFLGESGIDDIYRHLSYALELGGEDNISLGSDYDGAEIHENISSIDKMTDLCDYLIGRNLPERILNKVFYQNALRVFGERKGE